MTYTLLNLLQSHSSVRHYKDEPISKEQLHELLKSGQHASSSNFVQAYSVIHVTDEDQRKQLATLSNNELQINHAPIVLLFCADLYRVKLASEKHQLPFYGETAENFVVATIDTALFAQNVAIAAESKGYGICYIGGIRNEIEKISNLFNLPNHVLPLFGMTIGVPELVNEVKPRLPMEAILHENTYSPNTYEDVLKAYDSVINEYYKRRSTNQKDISWTKSMAQFLGTPRRDHMKQFIHDKGFFLK